MWGNDLVRNIVRWMGFDRSTPQALFEAFSFTGIAVPDWLAAEPEMENLNHVVSKGTQAVILYRAMIAAAKEGE
jgi:hypothetical protein